MKEGRVNSPVSRLYGYGTSDSGELVIVLEQAEIVKQMFNRILAADSLRMIRDALNADSIPARGEEWREATVRGIITNEKYCGDVLMQKTFKTDILSGKTSRNTGQLPMYFIRNSLGLCVVETCERKLLVFSGICRRGQLQIPASKVFLRLIQKQ